MFSLRHVFLICVWVFFYCVSLQADADRPNIVIIICDDLNDSISGMGGHHQALTPNIDRLSDRGVRFLNAASNSPICGPSRASLWSGLHPVTTGLFGGKQHDNRWYNNPVLKNKPTLFETMSKSGYRNFSTGKIHHNGHEQISIFENIDGFIGFGSHPNFGPLPNDGLPKNKRHGVLPPWWPDSHRNDGGWGDGFGPIQDVSKYGNGYGWSLFYSGLVWNYREGHNRDLMPDEVHAMEAVEFLSKKHSMPYLLTVGFSRPHSPWYAPQEFFDLYPLETVQLTPILEDDSSDCAKILTQDRDISEPWGWYKYERIMRNGGEAQLRKWTQAYLACVSFVDAQVGKILDAIELRDDADNTLIIFTSDHGYHMGEKEYVFKFSPWEESVRIPLIISGPGIAKDLECPSPVSLIDIYPTCMDYGSAQTSYDLDGFSLRELLEDPVAGVWAGPSISVAVSGSKIPVQINQPAKAIDQHFSLRSEYFRYIRCRNGEEEFYDHRVDPNEWTNQINNPNYRVEIHGFQNELSNILDERK
ncbi:MAG: sulfatase-like hydrolase/transferase [Verrucomicrobiota bacterium]|nr:sulfatase-like hydrolase/transferase [Verrucomicrobiota bacterium]